MCGKWIYLYLLVSYKLLYLKRVHIPWFFFWFLTFCHFCVGRIECQWPFGQLRGFPLHIFLDLSPAHRIRVGLRTCTSKKIWQSGLEIIELENSDWPTYNYRSRKNSAGLGISKMLLIHLPKNFQNFYNSNKKKASADSTDSTLDIVCTSWYNVFEVFLGLDQLAPPNSPPINQEVGELGLWSKFPCVIFRILKSSALRSADVGQSGTCVFFGKTRYFLATSCKLT